MAWKQRRLTSFSFLKSKRHLCIWIAGFVMFLLVLPYLVLSNHSNNMKIHALLEDLETLKSGMSTNTEKVNDIRSRKKRDVGKGKQQEHGPKSFTYASAYVLGGAVYIRWGRTTCPDNNTELVYDGIGGGSLSSHEGAATNLPCLPSKPVWGRYTDNGGNAQMYGMEYDDNMQGIMDMSNVQKSLDNHNVPCAVCRSTARTSALMIPAMNICVEGWHVEYHGYLMAGYSGHKSGTQYICIDESPEADPAGYRGEDGVKLYRVTAVCGSLPCPRYVNNRELPCAICTK